jgi:serine phosphatase RsbU (regulator of sigma subunit)
MRILIAWDAAEEAELLHLYLDGAENEAAVCLTAAEVQARLRQEPWDAILMSQTLPTAEDGLALFTRLQQDRPGVPVLMACRPSEIIALPRFLTRGLRFYLIRDDQRDFIFLVLSSLESAVAATRAEESRKLAERLREELDGVRRLQESIIPKGLEPPPGYATAARYEPSQVYVVGDRPVVMAGGDYYDLFRAGDRTLIALIGDASGHGLKACMSIMAMHTLIRMFPGDHYRDTAGFVSEINERLCENSIVQSDGGFITLFYAAIDTRRHTMAWTSAGHPPALIQDLATNEVCPVARDSDGGLPLGVAAGVVYESFTTPIPPRHRVLLFSDGLTDALPEGATGPRAFGVPGIVRTLQACRDRDLDETLGELFRASSSFTGGVGRHDDTSVMLLERLAD